MHIRRQFRSPRRNWFSALWFGWGLVLSGWKCRREIRSDGCDQLVLTKEDYE